MRIAILIATTGRADVLSRVLLRYVRQTRKPDEIVVCYAAPSDIGALPDDVVAFQGPRGLTSQRNTALNYAMPRADVVFFADDDYVPSLRCVEVLEGLFSESPEVSVITGAILADGVKLPAGIALEEAERMLVTYDAAASPVRRDEDILGVYGCNMAIRTSAIGADRFDERLPLYGWQEDIDFTSRISRRGKGLRTNAFAGVHMGAKAGRQSGRRFGYSQVVNPLYLAGKGTMRRTYALGLIARNIAANAIGALTASPHVDRRGRLMGNAIGIMETLTGRAKPERILTL